MQLFIIGGQEVYLHEGKLFKELSPLEPEEESGGGTTVTVVKDKKKKQVPQVAQPKTSLTKNQIPELMKAFELGQPKVMIKDVYGLNEPQFYYYRKMWLRQSNPDTFKPRAAEDFEEKARPARIDVRCKNCGFVDTTNLKVEEARCVRCRTQTMELFNGVR